MKLHAAIPVIRLGKMSQDSPRDDGLGDGKRSPAPAYQQMRDEFDDLAAKMSGLLSKPCTTTQDALSVRKDLKACQAALFQCSQRLESYLLKIGSTE